jgi:5-methylcytosine-specific restriction endonuclease McrBC GTP-binding regulatory subunit McrB
MIETHSFFDKYQFYTQERAQSKEHRFTRNQDDVSEWDDMSIRGLLFQAASNIQIQLSVLVWYKADLIIISLQINLFSPWYSWKIAELALNYISHIAHSFNSTRAIVKKILSLMKWTIVFCNQ